MNSDNELHIDRCFWCSYTVNIFCHSALVKRVAILFGFISCFCFLSFSGIIDFLLFEFTCIFIQCASRTLRGSKPVFLSTCPSHHVFIKNVLERLLNTLNEAYPYFSLGCAERRTRACVIIQSSIGQGGAFRLVRHGLGDLCIFPPTGEDMSEANVRGERGAR